MKSERFVRGVTLAEQVPDVLLPYMDRWVIQEPQAADLQIMQAMQAQMDAGVAWMLRHGLVYVFLRRVTPFRGEVHLYNLGSTWGMVRGFKAITKAALEGFHKLEARTADKRHGSVMMRCGWKHEATYEKSHMTPTGLVNEYGYGVARWEA